MIGQGAIVCEPILSIIEQVSHWPLIEVAHWKIVLWVLWVLRALFACGVHQVHRLERVKGAHWSLALPEPPKWFRPTFSAHTCELSLIEFSNFCGLLNSSNSTFELSVRTLQLKSSIEIIWNHSNSTIEYYNWILQTNPSNAPVVNRTL